MLTDDELIAGLPDGYVVAFDGLLGKAQTSDERQYLPKLEINPATLEPLLRRANSRLKTFYYALGFDNRDTDGKRAIWIQRVDLPRDGFPTMVTRKGSFAVDGGYRYAGPLPAEDDEIGVENVTGTAPPSLGVKVTHVDYVNSWIYATEI